MVGTLDALRRPEYTGENRCTPCTIVNAIIAFALAAAVWWAAPLGPLGNAGAGVAVLAGAGAAIWLRGYLVPGTPWLTRTYLPDRVLRYFEHAGPAAEGDVEPIAVLEAADAVTECEDVDDLCLTDEFHEAWYDQMTALRAIDASRAELAGMLDLDADGIDLEEHGEAYVALADGGGAAGRWRVGQWESPGAFLADMAGARVLGERVPGWDRLDAPARGRVLNGLRVFLDACPSCGGGVTLGEETVRSCCRSKEVVAVTCTDCGDRLFEAEQPEAS